MAKKFDTSKIIEPIMRFVNMKGVIALKDGMLAILPLTVIGSVFLIIGQIPSEAINTAIAGVFENVGLSLSCKSMQALSLLWV